MQNRQESRKNPLIVLTGPTAAGKTALSIQLAKAVGGEIISADSMQVYRGMDIGSAKVMPEEMEGIPHYLIDAYDPEEDFNIAEFKKAAENAIRQIYAHGHIPIIVGGTGFYIQAVLKDLQFEESENDHSYRNMLEQLAEEKGEEYLHQMLKEVDPEAAAEIHPHNRKRVIRALEFYEETGQKISDNNARQKEQASPYNFCYFVLNLPRELLYQRIDRRVDQMLEQGLEEEVRKLRSRGCRRDMVSMQGLGYKEMLDYLEGDISLEEAVYRIKRDTRHFAKRQLTWFRREPDVIWINKEEYNSEEELLARMLQCLREKNVIKD